MVHHSRGERPPDAAAKAEAWAQKILARDDKDKDGRLALREFRFDSVVREPSV